MKSQVRRLMTEKSFCMSVHWGWSLVKRAW